MYKRVILSILVLACAVWLFGRPNAGFAESSFFSNYCSGCHGANAPATCAGCHSHGTHPDSRKSSINITATTDKTTYQPGETMSVTVNGGYRSGWCRIIVYDQNMQELARSTGTVISGAIAPSGAPSMPVTLHVPAPTTPGTYTYNGAWYGNKYDLTDARAGTTVFGPRWTPDPTNPNHGQEIVATNSFTVASATPPPAPAITVTDSVAPTTDLTVPFGSVNVGASAAQTVTVTNSGTANLTVGAVGSSNPLAAPFSLSNDTCSNQTIAPSASCTMTVRFAPTATGSFTDSFTIPSNDAAKSSVPVNVSGTGVAVAVPSISVTDSVSPASDLSVPFGSVVAGSSASQTVTVTNNGSADLLVGSVGASNPLAAPFSITDNTCSNQTVAPAASCTMTIVFAPTATGTFTDSFNIPSNDPAKSSVTMNVSGTGSTVPAPVISITDSVTPNNDLLVPFGTVSTGASGVQTVTVANSGNAGLQIGLVGSTNPLGAPFSLSKDTCSNQTIIPSGSCTIEITFAPTADGTFTDSLDIPSNDPAKASVTLSVSGSGSSSAALGNISVADSVSPGDDLQIPFGTISQGRSSDQTVTISNAGTGDLAIGSIASSNPLQVPFSIVSDGCSNRTLSAGSSCDLTVRFAPAKIGTYTDSFDIPSDDPDQPSLTMQVNGVAVSSHGNNPPGKPKLRHPADHEQDLDTSLDMQWEGVTDPDGDSVSYRLHISADRYFRSDTRTIDVTPGETGKASGSLFASTGIGFIFFGFVFAGTSRGRKLLLVIAAITIVTGSALVGCGKISTVTPNKTTITRHVSGLDSTTTYYWKVEASDGNGGVTESDVNTFSTK
jgi:hypothetical protein